MTTKYAKQTRRRDRLRSTLSATVLLAVVLQVPACLNPGRRFQSWRVSEKISQREDRTCRAISWRSAPKGVILEVQCRSPVQGVVRKVKPRVVAPVPFVLVPKGKTSLILVPYPFAPKKELYLALITENLRAWSMSPYFPAKPDAIDAEYDQLVNSPQARYYDKTQSLKMLQQIAPSLPARDLDPEWQ